MGPDGLPWPVPDGDIARAAAAGERPPFALHLLNGPTNLQCCPLDPDPPPAPCAEPSTQLECEPGTEASPRRRCVSVAVDAGAPAPSARRCLALPVFQHRDFAYLVGPGASLTPMERGRDLLGNTRRDVTVVPLCQRGLRVAFFVATATDMEADADWTLVMVEGPGGWTRESLTHAPYDY